MTASPESIDSRSSLRLIAKRALAGALAVSLLLGMPALQAATLEGQHFDDTARVAGKLLRLNGLGLRSVAWIKGFVAGLYVAEPSNDAARLIESHGPKRVSLRILLDAPASEFVRAIHSGVRKNTTPEERERMASRVERFGSVVSAVGRVRVGDAIDIDYLPGKGLQVRHNGKVLAEPIPGDDLYRAVLKMFIGERAVDKEMRVGMLGGAVAQAPSTVPDTSPPANPAPIPSPAPTPVPVPLPVPTPVPTPEAPSAPAPGPSSPDAEPPLPLPVPASEPPMHPAG